MYNRPLVGQGLAARTATQSQQFTPYLATLPLSQGAWREVQAPRRTATGRGVLRGELHRSLPRLALQLTLWLLSGCVLRHA